VCSWWKSRYYGTRACSKWERYDLNVWYRLDWRLGCRCSGIAWDVAGKGGAVRRNTAGHLTQMTFCSATGCCGFCVWVFSADFRAAWNDLVANWPQVKMTCALSWLQTYSPPPNTRPLLWMRLMRTRKITWRVATTHSESIRRCTSYTTRYWHTVLYSQHAVTSQKNLRFASTAVAHLPHHILGEGCDLNNSKQSG
jgi:hypothetical protein